MTSTNTSKSVSDNKYPYQWGEYPALEKKDRWATNIHRVSWNPSFTWNFNFDLDDKKIVKNWFLTMNQQEIFIEIEWASGGKSMFNANRETDENVEYQCFALDDYFDPDSLEELYQFDDVWELDEIHIIDA